MHTVAIIGAGFSGAVLAARLLRATGRLPMHIALINRSRTADGLARGLAYGTQSESHRLNVPAGRMSAFPEAEDDFLRFLAARGINAEGGSFVARRYYGEYLAHTLASAIEHCTPGQAYSQHGGEVIDLRREGGRSLLHFADGSTLMADQVVLALGNFAPADPHLPDRAFLASPRYIRDPWAPGALAAVENPVALIGTGLTMFDVALTLAAESPVLTCTAISRRGVLPQPHRHATAAPKFDHAPPAILSGPSTVRAYMRSVRAEVSRLAAQGVDWREVIASLRPITPDLWQRLPDSERARFLRHLRPWWDGHRHRAAPDTAATIHRLTENGQLRMRAARLLEIRDTGGHLQLSIRARGSDRVEPLSAGTVINCTGPTSDFRLAGERLLLALQARGQVAQDPLRLGLMVNERLQICDRQGRANEPWYCVGPMLKARDWEAVAVPELRRHVRDLAAEIVNSL